MHFDSLNIPMVVLMHLESVNQVSQFCMARVLDQFVRLRLATNASSLEGKVIHTVVPED